MFGEKKKKKKKRKVKEMNSAWGKHSLKDKPTRTHLPIQISMPRTQILKKQLNQGMPQSNN